MPSRNMSPEERTQIEVNRLVDRHGKQPFKGKNRAQRWALHGAFNAMASVGAKLGLD